MLCETLEVVCSCICPFSWPIVGSEKEMCGSMLRGAQRIAYVGFGNPFCWGIDANISLKLTG